MVFPDTFCFEFGIIDLADDITWWFMIILQEFLQTCLEHSINFVDSDVYEQIFDV